MADNDSGLGYRHTWTLIRNISHLIGRARDRELSQYGITIMQSAILYMVKAFGEQATPGNIARAMYREPTTVSNTLIRMEKQGLVHRFHDTMRRSQVRITLTEEGERAYLDSDRRESVTRIMSQLSPDTYEQLRKSLVELRGLVLADLGFSPSRPHLPTRKR